MNEGVGSTVVIAVIVVFIALVSGYMAYNVNYTKAFRMKDKIVNTLEKYNGVCNGTCEQEIRDYAGEIGYNPMTDNFCDRNKHKPDHNLADTVYKPDGYCLYKVSVLKTVDNDVVDDKNHQGGYYYRVATIINIRIPIMEKWMQFNYVSGDTKAFFPDEGK